MMRMKDSVSKQTQTDRQTDREWKRQTADMPSSSSSCTVCGRQSAAAAAALLVPKLVGNSLVGLAEAYLAGTLFVQAFYRDHERIVLYANLDNGDQAVLLMAPRIDTPWTINLLPPTGAQTWELVQLARGQQGRDIAADVKRKAAAALRTAWRRAPLAEWKE
eukprot:3940617-Rhodomonas_salina.1